MLDKIFSDSNIDLYYDSTESTISKIKYLNYNTTKTLYKYLFIKRAERIVKESWLITADFYKYLTAHINSRYY